MEFKEDPEADAPALTKAQKTNIRRVSRTVKAYVDAVKKLLEGKYAGIRHLVPAYMANPGNVLAALCEDGIVVRFEANGDEKTKVRTGWIREPLPQVARILSQNLVHVHDGGEFEPATPPTGMELRMFIVSGVTGEERDLWKPTVRFDAVLERPTDLPGSPQKPFCLLSVRNSMDIQVGGVEYPSDGDPKDGHQFIARTTIRLPVGWECIEVYPFVDFSHWDPKWAPVWAQNDILGAVVTAQQREQQLQQLDPNAAARRQFAAMLDSYRQLLDQPPENEEVLQQFMQNHPELLCPSYGRVWPKLALGDKKTDFVFREAAGDYLLVELEPSTDSLFRKDGHASAKLTHAQGQILDWKRYLEDNLATVQRELELTGMSSNPSSLIVIGRSESLTPDNSRKLTTAENSTPKMRIMTYDDVYDNAKAVIENLLGPMREVSGQTQIYYPPTDGP